MASKIEDFKITEVRRPPLGKLLRTFNVDLNKLND